MKMEPIIKFATNYWQLILGLVAVVVLVVFFLSYSLARHKRMVFSLRTELLKQKTLLKVEQLEKKSAIARLRLQNLSSSDDKVKAERKKIAESIKEIDKNINKAKYDLKHSLTKVNDKTLTQLLKQAEQLEKDTL